MKQKDFWFDVSFWEEDRTPAELTKAIEACHGVHVWTIEQVNQYWLKHESIPSLATFRSLIASHITGSKWLEFSQRYSLDRAAEQAFSYATLQIKEQKKRKLARAIPLEKEEFDKIQIESRKVWRKYLSEDRGITTVFGIIFPEEGWKKIVRSQAGKESLMLVPFLWHSVTIWRQSDTVWKMKFNLHKSNSIKGKKAKKELQKELEEDAKNLLPG